MDSGQRAWFPTRYVRPGVGGWGPAWGGEAWPGERKNKQRKKRGARTFWTVTLLASAPLVVAEVCRGAKLA